MATVTMEDQQELYAFYRMVPFSMILSDPNLNFKVTVFFNVK